MKPGYEIWASPLMSNTICSFCIIDNFKEVNAIGVYCFYYGEPEPTNNTVAIFKIKLKP